jgi:hypothetical protein
MNIFKKYAPAWTLMGALVLSVGVPYLYAQTFLRRAPAVYYAGSLPANGEFDGQIGVLIIEGSDAKVSIWNNNDDAWEPIAGDDAAVTPTTVTSTTITGTTVNAGALNATGAVDFDTTVNIDGITTLQQYTSIESDALFAQFRDAANTFTYGQLNTKNGGLGINSLQGLTLTLENNLWEWGEIKVEVVNFTAAQVQGMTTPVDVSEAPAADSVMIMTGATLYLAADGTNDFAGVAGGEDFVIAYETSGDVVSSICDTATCIDLDAATADYGFMTPTTAAGYSLTANLGKKLQMKFNGGDGVTGGADNDLQLAIRYVEFDTTH